MTPRFPIHSFQDVEPFLELRDSGPTHDWCSKVARELECYVVASFPEKVEEDSDSGAYLSQMVVDREGRVVGVHRNGFGAWLVQGYSICRKEVVPSGKKK